MLPKPLCPPSTHRPRPRFSAWVLSCPCSAKTCLLFCCPLPASSENKEEVQLQMSSCKVIKLTAWGLVLLRAGEWGRGGLRHSSARRDLLFLTSFPSLMEVALPHVAVQVVTLWDTGSLGCVLGHAGTVNKATASWLHWPLACCRLPHLWQ